MPQFYWFNPQFFDSTQENILEEEKRKNAKKKKRHGNNYEWIASLGDSNNAAVLTVSRFLSGPRNPVITLVRKD